MVTFYRIAVVDDEPDQRYLLAKLLRKAGHTIQIEAGSGQEVLKLLPSSMVDLAILDIRMPGIDGIETARLIWQLHKLPSIFITAFASDRIITKVAETLSTAVLVKPVRQPELLSAINATMQSAKEVRQLQEQAANARQELEDRKLIERAKGILMRDRALSEPAAFELLQQIARSQRKKLACTAESIIRTSKS